MEIKDHLQFLRRRLWIVVLVPLVAAGATAALAMRRPPEYRATATVAVPGLVGGEAGQFSGSTGNRAFVANFLAVVHSRAIAEAVAADTGVPVDSVLSGTVTSALGESSLVKVTYETVRKADADPVVMALATKSLSFMFDPRRASEATARAQQAVDAANGAVNAAQGAIDAFVAETKLANPAQDYQVKAQQIAALEEQAVAAGARGETAAAAIAQAAVAMKPQLAALGAHVARFNVLVEAKQRALEQLKGAQDRLVEVTSPPTLDPATAISVSDTTEVARLKDTVQKAAAAFAAALFLVFLALFTLDSMTRRPAAEPMLEPAALPGRVA